MGKELVKGPIIQIKIYQLKTKRERKQKGKEENLQKDNGSETMIEWTNECICIELHDNKEKVAVKEII